MKHVKTLAELQRFASGSGSSISIGTSRFNAAGSKVTPSKPVSAPPPVVEAPSSPAPAVIADTGRIEQMLERLLAAAPPPQVPVNWSIKVVRDQRGLMTDILLERN